MGNNIKNYRTKNTNISQYLLAKKLDMSLSYINRIENHKENVTVKTLARIAEALNCRLDDLWKI